MNITLEDVAKLTGGKIIKGDPSLVISGIASLIDAQPSEVSFLGNEKYFQDFLNTKSGIVIVPPNLPQYPEDVAFVEVENPSLAFNAVVRFFHNQANAFKPGIHPTAYVDPSVKVDPTKVQIGPHVSIDEDVIIGDGTQIGPHVTLYKGVKIGADCKIQSNVTVRERCILGDRVEIQPGAVIGSDGFGFLMGEDGKYVGIDQVGIVDLGNDVSTGANTTIDRARFGRTVIGEGTTIDNLVQIVHNCVIGKHCIIVSQTGIAGSTEIGDYCTIAAQVGIAGHLKIEAKAVLAARTGVMNNLEGNQAYWGSPSSPYKQACREFAALKKLPDIMKEFKMLKKTFLSED